MRALSPVIPSAEFTLAIVNGPEKGTIYKLMGNEVTIGRGSDNDIIITNDPKCSRKHAAIRLTDQGYMIEDISGKNKIWVNGQEVSSSPLHPSMTFIVGETELRFDIVGLKAQTKLKIAPNRYPDSPAPFSDGRTSMSSPKLKPQSSPLTKRLILYGTVGAVLYFLLSPSSKKPEETTLRTEQQIEAEIELAKKLQEEAEKKKMGTNNLPFEEAQGSYVRGFRDYKKGQFGSAMESFQACLSLYPEHVLCNRYLRLSQRRFNELVQYHMILGRKYREQNQYSACAAAFRNVMMMVRDTNSKAYKEARANFDACQAFIEERF